MAWAFESKAAKYNVEDRFLFEKVAYGLIRDINGISYSLMSVF